MPVPSPKTFKTGVRLCDESVPRKAVWRVYWPQRDTLGGGKKVTAKRMFSGKDAGEVFRRASAFAEERHREIRERGERSALTKPETDAAAAALAITDRAGVHLLKAVQEWEEARAALAGAGLPPDLRAAAAGFISASRAGAGAESRTVEEVAAEWMQAKRLKGVSGDYLDTLKKNTARFLETFGRMKIDQVKVAHLAKFFADGVDGVGDRTVNNFQRTAKDLFRFARSRNYLPRDRETEASYLEERLARPAEAPLYTAAQLRAAMARVEEDMAPWLAVMALAGTRPSEAHRLTWDRIDFEEGTISLRLLDTKRKNRAHFFRPHESLMAWLRLYRRPSGRIAPDVGVKALTQRLMRRFESAGVEYEKNGLRKTFQSNYYQLTGDVDAVARSAGTSSAMSKEYYMSQSTKKAALEWFSVTPDTVRPS